MNPPHALFFDLDGTLLDDSGMPEATLLTCIEVAAGQPDLDADRLFETNGLVWREYWPAIESRWTLGSLDTWSLSLEAWHRTLRACGCDDESLARSAASIHERHIRDTYRLFADARRLLEELSNELPLALVTNGASDTQRAKLGAVGLEHRFGAVVISGEVGVAKPDPTVFRPALDALGVAPDRAWHVGDSLQADVAGARAAGLEAVWLNRSGVDRRDEDVSPDREISSLTDLLARTERRGPGR